MTKIALIGCTALKKNYPCTAREMYSASNYFNLRLKYAIQHHCIYIYILSAKYGLISLNTFIEPYNLNLKETNKKYQKIWSYKVLKKLDKKHNLQKDCFYLLAGNEYVKYLQKNINNTYNPVKNMGIGKQLKFYKNEVK